MAGLKILLSEQNSSIIEDFWEISRYYDTKSVQVLFAA